MKNHVLTLCLSAALVALSGSVAAQQATNPNGQNGLPANPMASMMPAAQQPSAPQSPGQYPGYPTAQAVATNPYAQPSQVNGLAPNSIVNPNTNQPPVAPPTSLPPLPPQSNFEAGVERNIGMSPDEIRQLRRMLDDRQRAASEMPNPPKSVTGSVSVSLSPGSTPPVVRPFYGVSTSIVILDSTGAPWPVENFSVGNKALFAVERLDGPGGSTFTVSATQQYGQSNLIFKLAGAATPVVINLVGGQHVHDARVEARVQGRGPNASVSSASLIQGVDTRLLSVLDGVPPQGRAIEISGDSRSKAWAMPNGRIWLRTAITVVSPAPIAFVSASDGTRVYEIMPSSKVLGMANDQFVTIDLLGCLQECATVSDNQSW